MIKGEQYEYKWVKKNCIEILNNSVNCGKNTASMTLHLIEQYEKLQRENQSLKDQLKNAKNQNFNSFMKDNRFR